MEQIGGKIKKRFYKNTRLRLAEERHTKAEAHRWNGDLYEKKKQEIQDTKVKRRLLD